MAIDIQVKSPTIPTRSDATTSTSSPPETPPTPESLWSTPTLESLCATPPPGSPRMTPTPEPAYANSTAYYYISHKRGRLYPDTSSITPYKPLPEGWDESRHYWLYGWPVSNRYLQALLRKYFDLSDVSTGPIHDAVLVLGLLERLGGYWHLTQVTCKASEEAKKEGIVEYISGDLGIPFVMVSCTARKRFFQQRPTEEQLEYLSGILGEPRWLESRSVREEFPLDIIQ